MYAKVMPLPLGPRLYPIVPQHTYVKPDTMIDPRVLNLPHRGPPQSRRQFEIARQRQRATYSNHEYDYDALPAGPTRVRPTSTPRSHPAQFGEQQQMLPFDEAARKLYQALQDSRIFFTTFHQNFLAETKGVLSYADAKVLDHLWRLRVEDSLKRDRQSGNPGFKSTSEQLGLASLLATQSVPRRSTSFASRKRENVNSEADVESMKRLIKRMQAQHCDLSELIRGSCHSTRVMVELIQDISLLLQVLDGSRELWAGVPKSGKSSPPPPPPHVESVPE